ncbi:MAG: class I SAM-dependent methyltransferase, partial [Gemmatimonadetes bacterium]|nr:class I SAM-dependent methyltransferase [Gemmatimonadota bacterium]
VMPEAIRLAGLARGDRVLEVGCGTGQATLPLAREGLEIVALEPGPALARIAQARLAGFPNVEVVLEPFEAYGAPHARFAAVIAATSFHWLDPDVRVRRAAELVRRGGALVLLSNVQRLSFSEFFERVQAVYQVHLPEWPARDLAATWSHIPEQIEDVDRGGWFETVAVRTFDWRVAYPRDRYLELLRTFSDHRSLPEPRLTALLADIGTLIDAEFDGRVVQPWRTILQVARRSAQGVEVEAS